MDESANDIGVLFIRTLRGDVERCKERVGKHDSQGHRRELIRAAWSAIEGSVWLLRQAVQLHLELKPFADLSLHEKSALLEQTYVVNDRGTVKAQQRFLPVPVAIRLVVATAARLNPSIDVDFQDTGWERLKRTVEVRNRIVHPRRARDLDISDEELKDCLVSYRWISQVTRAVGQVLTKEIAKTVNDQQKRAKRSAARARSTLREKHPREYEALIRAGLLEEE